MNEQADLFSQEPLHTFSIGLEGAPDLAAAQEVADMIGTVHHGFTFTVQEGIDALFDVVWHIESYEQIRASVPMYILSRKIKAMGYKVCWDGHPILSTDAQCACLSAACSGPFRGAVEAPGSR
jgi:asparagine synthetase B (glutamine-hydrolysing)